MLCRHTFFLWPLSHGCQSKTGYIQYHAFDRIPRKPSLILLIMAMFQRLVFAAKPNRVGHTVVHGWVVAWDRPQAGTSMAE